jgi:hypothetical protein
LPRVVEMPEGTIHGGTQFAEERLAMRS